MRPLDLCAKSPKGPLKEEVSIDFKSELIQTKKMRGFCSVARKEPQKTKNRISSNPWNECSGSACVPRGGGAGVPRPEKTGWGADCTPSAPGPTPPGRSLRERRLQSTHPRAPERASFESQTVLRWGRFNLTKAPMFKGRLATAPHGPTHTHGGRRPKNKKNACNWLTNRGSLRRTQCREGRTEPCCQGLQPPRSDPWPRCKINKCINASINKIRGLNRRRRGQEEEERIIGNLNTHSPASPPLNPP